MTKPLPSITPKQQAILKLIYRYRFLNRIQIQALLKHKDKRRIISWLKDLREKQYVDWHYAATDFIAKSQPGIYYLSLNGIRYLHSLNNYPNKELRKRYKEPTRTKAFIDHCLLMTDCCTTLQAKTNDELRYDCVLPTDYVNPDNEYHFLDEIKPHLFFSKQRDEDTTHYLLENFEPALPRYQLRKRLKDYIDYLAGDWNENNGQVPVALFICPNVADLLYVKRRLKKVIDEEWPDEGLHIRVTTLNKIRTSGVASMIWEEV